MSRLVPVWTSSSLIPIFSPLSRLRELQVGPRFSSEEKKRKERELRGSPLFGLEEEEEEEGGDGLVWFGLIEELGGTYLRIGLGHPILG